MKNVDAPIIPVNLDGVWGSIFSYERGRFIWKMPRKIPYPVTVSFGKPMPPTTTSFEVREAVQELQTEAYRHHKKRMHTLPRSLIRTAHHYPFRFAHGRQAPPAHDLGQRVTQRDLPCATPAQNLGRPGNGWHPAAAVGPRRTGKLRRSAKRQNPGKSELHRLQRNARVLRAAMQNQNRNHHQAAAGKNPAESPRKTNPAGRSSRKTKFRGTHVSANAVVPSKQAAGTRAHERGQQPHKKSRRSSHHNFFQRQHRRTQRRDAHALQRHVQHRPDGPNIHAGQRRRPPRRPALFPLLRFHRHALAPRSYGSRRRIPSQPTRPHRRQRTGSRLSRNVPPGHADISASVHASLLPRRFRQPAIRSGRRREIARAAGASLRRPLRHPSPRRIRRDRMFPSRRGQHARLPRPRISPGRRKARTHRPPVTRHHSPHRRSRNARAPASRTPQA